MIESSAWPPYVVMGFVVGVPALVGAGLIVAAVRRWHKVRTLAASGQRVTAQVVDNQLESLPNRGTRFRPVVTFQPSPGQEVTTVLADLAGLRSHVVGTRIDVVYDPRNPTEASSVGGIGWRLLIPLGFGLAFLALARCAYQIADVVLGVFREVGSVDPGMFEDPGFNLDRFGAA